MKERDNEILEHYALESVKKAVMNVIWYLNLTNSERLNISLFETGSGPKNISDFINMLPSLSRPEQFDEYDLLINSVIVLLTDTKAEIGKDLKTEIDSSSMITNDEILKYSTVNYAQDFILKSLTFPKVRKQIELLNTLTSTHKSQTDDLRYLLESWKEDFRKQNEKIPEQILEKIESVNKIISEEIITSLESWKQGNEEKNDGLLKEISEKIVNIEKLINKLIITDNSNIINSLIMKIKDEISSSVHNCLKDIKPNKLINEELKTLKQIDENIIKQNNKPSIDSENKKEDEESNDKKDSYYDNIMNLLNVINKNVLKVGEFLRKN